MRESGCDNKGRDEIYVEEEEEEEGSTNEPFPEQPDPPLQQLPPASSGASNPTGILQRIRSWCPWKSRPNRQTYSPRRIQSDGLMRSHLPPPTEGGGPFRLSGSDAELYQARYHLRENLPSPLTLLRLDSKAPAPPVDTVNCQEGRENCPCRHLSAALQLQHHRWMARWQSNEEAIRRMQQEQAHQLQTLEDLQTANWVDQIDEGVLVRDVADGKDDVGRMSDVERDLGEVE